MTSLQFVNSPLSGGRRRRLSAFGSLWIAADMVRYGVDLVGVTQAGRWKTSAMVARYSARLPAKRGGMAQIADRRVQF